MKIVSIRLQNFQGVKDALYEFHGENATVYGDNETGKTTLFNAITWLLFDQASTGAKNYLPKTKGKDGADVHKLEHSVEMTVTDGQGVTRALRKVLKEKYTKRKGASRAEFTGHTTEYFIDEEPLKELDYHAALLGLIGGEEKAKTLMMPNYFAEVLPWQDRRQILVAVCGDISDEEILDSTPELAPLRAQLPIPGQAGRMYTVEQYRSVVTSKAKEVNKALAQIPARIEEASRMIPDELRDMRDIEADMDVFTRDMEAKKHALAQLRDTDADTAARQKIAELKVQLEEARGEHIRRVQEVEHAVLAVQGRIDETTRKLSQAVDAQGQRQMRLERMKQLRKDLHEQYALISQEQWRDPDNCPTCHQPLPAAQIEEARAAFNQSKASRLEEINWRGKSDCSQAMIDALEQEIKAVDGDIEKLRAELESLHAEKAGKTQAPPPFESTPAYHDIMARIEDLQADSGRVVDQSAQTAAGLQEQVRRLEAKLAELRVEAAQTAAVEQHQTRIQELEDLERKLAREYEALELGRHLCDEFLRAKVAAIEGKINSRFTTVRFRMFEEQVNGGLKEGCEALVPAAGGRLVPFALANNAARINAGLEIIDTLGEHWGLSVPVIVDNAESVTRLRETAAQLIRLVVSEKDKKLRVELESDRLEEAS